MNTRFPRPSSPLQTGVTATVKWFNASKGFGFVSLNDGSSDAFLHISVLQRAGLSPVGEGAVVVCDLEQGPKGPQVCQVISVDTENMISSDLQPYESEGAEGTEEVIEGIVRFFCAKKGYGFVQPDREGSKDIFVGIGCLNRCGIQELKDGQRVRVSTRMGKKGPMAKDVEPI